MTTAALGGLGCRVMEEGGVSVFSLPFVPSLGFLVTQDAGFGWDASAETSFLAGRLGFLPARSAYSGFPFMGC